MKWIYLGKDKFIDFDKIEYISIDSMVEGFHIISTFPQTDMITIDDYHLIQKKCQNNIVEFDITVKSILDYSGYVNEKTQICININNIFKFSKILNDDKQYRTIILIGNNYFETTADVYDEIIGKLSLKNI